MRSVDRACVPHGPETAFGEVRNRTQDWKGSSEARDILAAQKPPCRCACNSLILGDRDSPIYAAQNHMMVGNSALMRHKISHNAVCGQIPVGRQISLWVFPLRRDGRPAKPRATKVPIEPTLLRMECYYRDITSESTRRRLCQNFAEAAGDNHILARLQHPNTHHNLVSVFGDTSASLRGAGCGI